MQMLEAAGVPILTDGVRAADEDNPRGYYELDAAKRLAEDASFLDGAEGHAVMVPRDVFDSLGASGALDSLAKAM